MPIVLGIENLTEESGVVIRKDSVTATPDQDSSWPATNLITRSPIKPWRTDASVSPDDTKALVRLPGLRNVRCAGVLQHNMSRTGMVRFTADDEWAVKPAVLFDGVDDKGVTSTSITGSADVTLIGRFRLIGQPVANNTGAVWLFSVGNGLGVRMGAYFQSGAAGFQPFSLLGIVYNWGAAANLLPAAVYPTGQVLDVALRYRDSDQRADLFFDGVQVATTTASAVWPNNGDERISIGVNNAGLSQFGTTDLLHLEYWGEYLSDSRIASFRAAALIGTEKNLLGAWLVTEGTGSTVADVKGVAPMTLTGGTWVERVRHDPRWSTGAVEVWGQWKIRKAFQCTSGASITSPNLGAAPRSITVSFLVRVEETDTLSVALGFFGPSWVDCELGFSLTVDGKLRLRTQRAGATITATSALPINDGALRRVRGVLDGINNVISLYLATDGGVETLQETTGGLSAYDAVGACVLTIGTGSGIPTSVTADWRVYSCVRLEADDALTRDAMMSVDPDGVAQVRLNGSVVDLVDTTRTYSVASPAYVEIEQTITDRLYAANIRRGYGEEFAQYERMLVRASSADVEVTEVLLEVCDVEIADGYLQIGCLPIWSGFEPGKNRIIDSRRFRRQPDPERSRYGILSEPEGYVADTIELTLRYLELDEEARELLVRLERLSRTALVAIINEDRTDRDAYIIGHPQTEGLRETTITYGEMVVKVESAIVATAQP